MPRPIQAQRRQSQEDATRALDVALQPVRRRCGVEVSLARDCLILAIEVAQDEVQLAGWWGRHQGAMRTLTPDELAAVIAAKDRRVAGWARELDARLKRRDTSQSRFW